MIFIPPARKNGTLRSDGEENNCPAIAGAMDAPMERDTLVTPDAAERSSGFTTAIVYDCRVGTSI